MFLHRNMYCTPYCRKKVYHALKPPPPFPVCQFWRDSYFMFIGVGVSCHISYSITSFFSAIVILVLFSVSVRRSLLYSLVLRKSYVILLRHSQDLPYNNFQLIILKATPVVNQGITGPVNVHLMSGIYIQILLNRYMYTYIATVAGAEHPMGTTF